MVTVADIKKDLPNWPDDVIDIWLLPLANQTGMGWPPPNPLGDHRWKLILGEKPLEWWKKVDWKLESTDCSFQKLGRWTKHTINQMFAAHIDGKENAYGEEPERFFRQLKVILQNGEFPVPIVAVPVASGLSVIDGNNRIAAHACALSPSLPPDLLEKFGGKRPSANQHVWLGTHSDGEMLED